MSDVISSIQSDCAFFSIQNIISSKWNINIVLEILTAEDSLSFSEISAKIPEISPRMLSMRLKSLTEAEVISLIPNIEKPKKVRYALTKSGKELSKVLHVMREWSLKYGNCENEICIANQCRHGIAIQKLVDLQLAD